MGVGIVGLEDTDLPDRPRWGVAGRGPGATVDLGMPTAISWRNTTTKLNCTLDF